MTTEEGGTAPPPSPREGEAKAAKEKGGILKLQHIFEKYGGSGPAIPPKLAAILGPRSQGDLCRSQPSRLRHVECIPQSESTGSSALKPEILELTCEVPGAIVTPYGVGVRESQDDEGFVHVKFPWGTAAVAVKDTDDSRSAVLRHQLDSLGSLFASLVADLGPPSDESESDWEEEPERPQGLAPVKALLAWLEKAALEPKASHQQVLLDLALLLSGLVSGRAELLRLEGIGSSPQLQAELMAADALRIHLGLLERLSRSCSTSTSRPRSSALAESCRSWCKVLEQVGADQLIGGAWRLVRPGAKQADPLSEEELLSSLPTARRSSFIFQVPTRLSSRPERPEITSVKVTHGPILMGPPRTTVVTRPSTCVIPGSGSPLTRAQRLPTASPFSLPRQLSGTPAVAYSAALPPGPCSVSPDVVRRSSTPFCFAPSPLGNELASFWLPERLPSQGEPWSFSPLRRSRPSLEATLTPMVPPARETSQMESSMAGSELQSSLPTSLPTETPATASPETPATPQASEPDVTCSLARTKAKSLFVGRIQRKAGKDTPKSDKADKAPVSPIRRTKSEKAPVKSVKAWR